MAPSALSASQGDFWVCRIPTAKRLILSVSKKRFKPEFAERRGKTKLAVFGTPGLL